MQTDSPSAVHGLRSAGLEKRPARPLAPVLLVSFLLGAPAVSEAQEPYTLLDLLRIGRERNPTVLALRSDLAAAEADRRASSRWENPALEFESGTGERYQTGDRRAVEGWSVRQTIENPLARHHRLASFSSLAAAAGEEVRMGILEVEYEIRTHFFRILFLSELLELARLNEEALGAISGLVEVRAEMGEVRELEAIRLRVEHLRARNETEAAAMELDQYRRHLNTFLGNALPPDFLLAGELAAGEEEPELDVLTEEILPDHPALLGAAREREAATSAMRATGSGWIPDPVVSGSSRRELDGKIRTLGIGLQVPLWDFSRTATERERQKVRALEERERALRQELEAQVMIHHNHLRLDRRTLALFEEGLLGEAEVSMQIAEAAYREGEISFLEYLDARRTYRFIQIDYRQALYDWNVERAALERAAGGGTL
jgi:outer membrane protein, heavy metal efflux system